MKFRDDWDEVDFSRLFNFEVRLLLPLIIERLGLKVFRHKFSGTINLISEKEFEAGDLEKKTWHHQNK